MAAGSSIEEEIAPPPPQQVFFNTARLEGHQNSGQRFRVEEDQIDSETARSRCAAAIWLAAADRSPAAAGYKIGGRLGATALTRSDGEISARGEAGAALGRGLPCAVSIPKGLSYTAAADRVRLRQRPGATAAPVPWHRPVRRDGPNRMNFCTAAAA